MRLCLNCGTSYATTWTCPSCGTSVHPLDGVLQFAPDLAQANDGFEPEYFSGLEAKESGHFWFEARNDLVKWAARKYAGEAKSVLEIGCGTGFVLSGLAQALPAAKLAASEIFTAGLGVAMRRVPQAEFMQMDARRIPFSGEFDLVGAFDVIEHIEQDEEVMRSAHRALKPGGVFFITVPQHMWLWSKADDFARHKRRYTRKEMVGKLERNGFKILRSTSFVSALLPAMFASRLLEKKSQEYDPAREFTLPRVINSAFRRAMSAEALLIRRGVDLPAGGSLLVVAQKE